MARTSERVKNWSASKGKCKTAIDIHDAIESNRNILWDIKRGNKSWGKEWYNLVEDGLYKYALLRVTMDGKGDKLNLAINCIEDIIALEAEMKGGIN